MSLIYTVILWAHSFIHKGYSYKVDVNDAALGAAADISIYFKMPNITARIHCIYQGYASDAATFEILEASTVTANTGAALVIYNRDRNSTNKSVVFNNATVPLVNSAMKDVTITADGTQIHHELFSDKKLAGMTRDENEFILKKNTNYVYRITSRAAGAQAVQLTLNWYEEGV